MGKMLSINSKRLIILNGKKKRKVFPTSHYTTPTIYVGTAQRTLVM